MVIITLPTPAFLSYFDLFIYLLDGILVRLLCCVTACLSESFASAKKMRRRRCSVQKIKRRPPPDITN